MIADKRVLAVIPARGGSKGILHKNIADICGKPMIAYTVRAAADCGYIDRCVVSTDDSEIADAARQSGGEVPFMRPEHLSTDTAKSIDVLLHAVEYCEGEDGPYDIIILLQPTSPLRTGQDITGALESFIEGGCASLAAVSEVKENPILIRDLDENGFMTSLMGGNATVRRQDMRKYYFVNGSIYINLRSELHPETSLNDNRRGYRIPKEHSIDIDVSEDLEYVRWVLGGMGK